MNIPAQISAVLHFLGVGAPLGFFLLLSRPGGTGLFGVTNDAWTFQEQLLIAGGVAVLVLAVAQLVLATQGSISMRIPIVLIGVVDVVFMFSGGAGVVLAIFLTLQAVAFAFTVGA
jgi:hypothetical protein